MSRQWLYPTLDKKSYFYFMKTGKLDGIILKNLNKTPNSKKSIKKNKIIPKTDLLDKRKKGYCYCGDFTIHVLTKDGWATVCNNTQQRLYLCKSD
ncbi:translin-associated factor X [Moumouvirus goulette]|uniref:Translin-associated factor X n=1 Tax=Moumouvirus goulette TaxID=1247379 RepID=M1PAY4_9VIRU|nr:translin-associated factor X [Moumouvirus goulette]AGF85019.1 translin-associated factor X [Moumouvirus goulette]